jgi:hypothetical protein
VGINWRTLQQCNNGHLHALVKVWVINSFLMIAIILRCTKIITTSYRLPWGW